jgi:hypothetical protein
MQGDAVKVLRGFREFFFLILGLAVGDQFFNLGPVVADFDGDQQRGVGVVFGGSD